MRRRFFAYKAPPVARNRGRLPVAPPRSLSTWRKRAAKPTLADAREKRSRADDARRSAGARAGDARPRAAPSRPPELALFGKGYRREERAGFVELRKRGGAFEAGDIGLERAKRGAFEGGLARGLDEFDAGRERR